MPPMNAVPKLLDKKRRGQVLDAAEIRHFIQGVASGEVTDAQVGAFTMAVRYRGMETSEQTALTLAMRDTGRVLEWEGLDGPVLDKHSTGGVGDWVSLALAPAIAAAGGFVPMISGRGLGHTGGTLDKLESIPGFSVRMDLDALHKLVRRNGLAMIGQGPDLAAADARLYAVRDVTATVESAPLIVSSILAKKLAECLDGLVLDVKTGNGASLPDRDQALDLARNLCATANRAGTPCRALLTDMDQPLGWAAGNGLEVREAIDFVSGRKRNPRLLEVMLGLGAELLVLGDLASDREAALEKLNRLLDSGAVAERFAIMVAGQGGPADLLEHPGRYLPDAPVVRPVSASQGGWITRMDTRALGMTVVRLGGGRLSVSDTIDPAVGLSGLPDVGDRFEPGQPLCQVHAGSEADWAAAAERVTTAIELGSEACAPGPVIHEWIRA
ncbi:MAG TPA: thymidine phosphorylase [Xanthomonadales bacterium]|nr:thymidine phosphorylase [Xanthomonadales bacterium]